MHKCHVCKSLAVCKLDPREGAYGPLFAPICSACWANEVRAEKEEANRLWFRAPKRKPWASLEDAAKYFHPVA